MTTLATTPVRLTAAGTMRLEVGDREAPLSSRKALGVLTYLALQPSRSESRERVAALLWSDSGADQARGSLRQTLRRLKQDLGEAGPMIEADRSTLRLTWPVSLDILEAIDEAERGRAPRLLAGDDVDLGRLFADLEDLDGDFNLWVAVQRERLTAQLVSRLDAAIAAANDDAELLALAEALIRVDPTHEGACRAGMRAHLGLGDTAQAMRLYERLWQVLDEDLDVEPSEQTQALYVAIKQGQARPAIGGGPAPTPTQDLLAPIAIVVEPSQGTALPDDFAYFSMIFRDEMIAALSRFRDWLVIDGEQGDSTPPTYRAYSLKLMLHGRDDSIMVALRLADRSDGHLVWAERYSVTLDGIAALHRTALRHLAVALNVHLSAPRLQSARGQSSPMGRKYELWMQAQALCGEWRPESETKAERILRDLIAGMPDFSPAMVALAQSFNARPIVYPGVYRQPEHLRECLDLTARAVALDPLDSRTHLCRAWAHAIAGSHAAALSHLDLALDLNENDPWTIISAGLGYSFAGEIEPARSLVAQAQAFGMRHSRAAQGYIATASYLIGDHAGSARAAEVAGDAIINLPAWGAASHMHLGDPGRAAASMALFLELARKAWVGPEAPTDRDIVDWFMGCFPIASNATRKELRETLLAALDLAHAGGT